MVSTPRKLLAFAAVLVALGALFLWAVNAGTLKVSPAELWNGLFVAYDENVATVYDLRFPRIFIALAGGAATAVSGVLLQAALRNPLADPGLIGINAGASLATVAVTALAPAWLFLAPLAAFAGGAVAFLLVYGLSWRGGLSPLRIILVGVAVSAVFSGLLSAVDEGTGSSLGGVTSLVNATITLKTWDDLWIMLTYGLAGIALAVLLSHRCDLLALQDKTARSLGVDVDGNRLAVSAVAVLLASVSTAIIGPISFLGLVVPHIARLLVGSSHGALIPFSALGGAALLLLADTLGRTLCAPYEISAAVIMSVVGGPMLIVLLRKARESYGQ